MKAVWRRITNAAVALAATIVAYQVYAVVAVPWLEPPAPVATASAATDEQWRAGAQSVGRYQQLLATYFPAGHWSLAGAPKVVESGRVMLVLEDYRRSDDGRVELSKCAVLTFPTPRVPGEPPPPDAIVFEAPGGATLQFDNDFNPARGKIGRPVRGVFPGELVIRSDMAEPGPHDDLRVVTRDMRLEETLLLTDAEATFRLGPHRASGRKLEIRLLRESRAASGGDEPGIVGVSSLELRDDFEATVHPSGLNQGSGPLAASGELRLTSEGPFRFDFTRFVASLRRDVRATLSKPGEPSDQLFCGELSLHLSETANAPTTLSPADEPQLARRQSRALGRLQPYMIEAIGDPVRLDSPARQASARGRQLRVWVAEQRLRVDGTARAPATLAHGLHETHAAWIDYRSPPEDSAAAIGELSMAGPGWLRVATRKNDPDRLLEMRWRDVDGQGSEALRLARDRVGQPLLVVGGRPEVAATGLGRIESDRLSVRLREVAPDGPRGPAIELGSGRGDGAQKLAVVAERIDATGAVRFRGRELEGSTKNLVAWFRTMETAEPTGSSGGSNQLGGNGADSDRLYRLTAGEVQFDVGLFGRKAEPTSLLCSDGVRFEDVSESSPTGQLSVRGAELRVDGLHQKHARLTVSGGGERPRAATKEVSQSGDSAAADHRGFAQIFAKGVRMWARELHLDQAAGRVWSDEAVDARMPLDDRVGRALAAGGGEATLRARGGLDFDGRTITLRDDVFAETADGWVHAAELTAELARPIDIRSGDTPDGPIEIAEVTCRGGVSIDRRDTDAGGQRSHQRARLETLRYNLQSGELAGDGPGWVRSVQLSTGDDGLASLAGGASPAKLRFLRVNFQRGVGGNMNQRLLSFHERVRGVYGPVLAWDQDLPVESPGGPPPDAVTLACDELRVLEDPSAAAPRPKGDSQFGPLELQALGSVRFEGESSRRGQSFVAEAAAASYTQSKEVFVLEGHASRDATLWIRQRPGEPPARSVARKIVYHRLSGRVKVEDIRGFDYQAGANPFPAPPRR